MSWRGEGGFFGDSSSDSRAQTTQDFAIGVSVFLLTVVFVLAYVPGTLAPLTASVDDGVNEQAERTATYLVSDLSRDGYALRLNESEREAFFEANAGSGTLVENVSLQSTVEANVSIEQLDGSPVDSAATTSTGDAYRNQSGALATRLVELRLPEHDDEWRLYRLTVRVW